MFDQLGNELKTKLDQDLAPLREGVKELSEGFKELREAFNELRGDFKRLDEGFKELKGDFKTLGADFGSLRVNVKLNLDALGKELVAQMKENRRKNLRILGAGYVTFLVLSAGSLLGICWLNGLIPVPPPATTSAPPATASSSPPPKSKWSVLKRSELPHSQIHLTYSFHSTLFFIQSSMWLTCLSCFTVRYLKPVSLALLRSMFDKATSFASLQFKSFPRLSKG